MRKWWRDEPENNPFKTLSKRAQHALMNDGIDSIEKLRASNPEYLLLIPNFGKLCLKQVVELLRSLDETANP